MEKLQRLIQEETGSLCTKDRTQIFGWYEKSLGKIQTLVVQNPCLDINRVINELAEQDSLFIPHGANAYVASDFNGSTNHIREDGKQWSVYAIQFYRLYC